MPSGPNAPDLATRVLFPLLLAVCLTTPCPGQSRLEGIGLSGQWFVAYTAQDSDLNPSEFRLKRGYVTVQRRFDERLSVRVTQDIAVDHEGDGEGDIEMRLKYGYLRYTWPDQGFLTRPEIEFGLVHRPWVDYEQGINRYRVQGPMFADRTRLLPSADYGVTVQTLLGGTLPQQYQDRVSRHCPGRRGSASLGVYNGGGYDAVERNGSKTMEARLTLRPWPVLLPGFQMTWAGAYGKGNAASAPDHVANLGFVAWEHPELVCTAQVYRGTGDLDGSALDGAGKALRQKGYSLFAEYHLPVTPLRLLGRYDCLRQRGAAGPPLVRTSIVGLSYVFLINSKLVVFHDRTQRRGSATRSSLEAAIEFWY